jgi:hypothetical protein
MVQRIAALLALAPALDIAYQEISADSFTASDLGIRT